MGANRTRPPPFTVVHGGGRRRRKYERTERQKYEERRRDNENAAEAMQRLGRVRKQLERFDEGAQQARLLIAPVDRRAHAEVVALSWHVRSLVDELRACLFQYQAFAVETWEATAPVREGEDR